MAYINYGAAALKYGDKVLTWGSEDTEFTVPSDAYVHTTLLMRDPDGVYTALWSGPGTLIHDGRVWSRTPLDFIRVSPFEANEQIADANRATVTLALPNEVFERQFSRFGGLADPGITHVTIKRVISMDGGATWEYLEGLHIEGRVSAPRLEGLDQGVSRGYTFDVATLNSDVDRGYTQHWDNDTQQQLYPNAAVKDIFFEHVQALEVGAQLANWPNLQPDEFTTQDPDDPPDDGESTPTQNRQEGRDDYSPEPDPDNVDQSHGGR